MEITSTSNKQIIYANSLKEKKYRDKENKYLIEGKHLISMCPDIECIFTTDRNFQSNKNYPVYYVDDKVMKKLSMTKTPQGIVAIAYKKKVSFNENKSKYLLLDNVSDPGNLGTIIRTALAFQIDQIILSNNSVDIYNDKVIRGSQGGLFLIDVLYRNLQEIIPILQSKQVKVYASTLHPDSYDLKSIKINNKYALIVGNEGSGIRSEIINMSDFKIKINHSNDIDSLNVGVATSIMLYQFEKDNDL